jgi:hypothetical protein
MTYFFLHHMRGPNGSKVFATTETGHKQSTTTSAKEMLAPEPCHQLVKWILIVHQLSRFMFLL